MSELLDGIPRARPAEPQQAALGVVVRRAADGAWEVLLGKRSRRSGFMPGHLAFPGGRLEERDEPGRPDALARCASREVAEETGLDFPPGGWLDVGDRTTPPLFPVRFDTRFFLAETASPAVLAAGTPPTDEIESLGFFRPARVLRDWAADLALVPPPVLPLLRALAEDRSVGLAELAGRLRETNRREQVAPRIEFIPGVWMLPVASATLPPATHTNVWMPGGASFVVIDPGSDDPGELHALLEVITRRVRETGSRPRAVLLTHHHRDHTAGTAWLASELGLPLWAHAVTLRRLDAATGGVAFAEVRDGETLDLEGTTLRVLHTPGHAPGHVAFHLPDRATLLAGDLASGVSTILIDPADGDMGQYLTSLQRVSALGCRTVLPAHGPPLGGSALTALVEHRRKREALVIEALSGGLVELSEIARHAYRDVPEMPAVLTARQTLSHLLDLERRGEVRRRDPDGRAWERAARG